MNIDWESDPLNPDRVQTREDFLIFLKALTTDRGHEDDLQRTTPVTLDGQGPNGWYNHSVSEYLEAMSAWVEATPNLGEEPSWRGFASILFAGKLYE